MLAQDEGDRLYRACQGRATDTKWLMVVHHSSRTNGAQMSGFQPCSVTPGEVIRTGPKDTWICGWSEGERGIFNSSYKLKLSVNMDIKNHWSTHTVHCSTDRKPAITLSVTNWNWVIGTAYFINPKISLVYTKHELIMQTQPPHEPSPALSTAG